MDGADKKEQARLMALLKPIAEQRAAATEASITLATVTLAPVQLCSVSLQQYIPLHAACLCDCTTSELVVLLLSWSTREGCLHRCIVSIYVCYVQASHCCDVAYVQLLRLLQQ
jgi:hypothetical protein